LLQQELTRELKKTIEEKDKIIEEKDKIIEEKDKIIEKLRADAQAAVQQQVSHARSMQHAHVRSRTDACTHERMRCANKLQGSEEQPAARGKRPRSIIQPQPQVWIECRRVATNARESARADTHATATEPRFGVLRRA
jgi:hypothetical protein